jgi:O-glycosyl hydrolase
MKDRSRSAQLATFYVLLGCIPVGGMRAADEIAITVNPAIRHQRIAGFGVNFNGTYFRPEQQEAVQWLVKDLGATIFRLDPYGQTNWEAVNDNDNPDEPNWTYYNDRFSTPPFEAAWQAGRYLNSLGIRPYLTLSGIPPAWMLDDAVGPPEHSVCKPDSHGAHLARRMYEEFAETVVSLAWYARNIAHLGFDTFGPVNETDCYPAEGPRVDPNEMPELLASISRHLDQAGLSDLKLIVPEQALLKNNYIGPILQSREVMHKVAAFALHSYGLDSAVPQVQRVAQSPFPAVPVWLTEYGDLNDLDRSSENEWNSFCMAASRRLIQALRDGVSAGLFWDAFDNYHEHYPRFTFYGLLENNNHVYARKKRYYAARQIYRFVPSGSVRIDVESDSSGVLPVAFQTPDGALVIAGLKHGPAIQLKLRVLGENRTEPWALYQTTKRLDCVKSSAQPAADGTVTIDMPDEAVFTLVREKKR